MRNSGFSLPVRATLAPLLGALFLGACVSPQPVELERYEFSRPEMGMPFRMVLYAESTANAEEAARAAFTRIRELNDLFTDYDSDSELSRLSRTSGQGLAVPVSDDLWRVLSRAQALAKQTDGAFDVTVGPYVNVWRRARRDRELPPPERLARARASVGYQHLRLNPRTRTVELLVPNMRLDLGGIAKGYALDEAMRILRQHDIQSALVGGGGDMLMSNPPPGQTGWRVEIAPLNVADAPPTRHVLLTHRALATSGDVFQYLEIDGERYSHIVDPRTGIGLTDQSLVTVIARDAFTADRLATAASVLGPERGLALLASTRNVEGYIVRRPDPTVEVFQTAGFPRYFEYP
jgi:thiamine biosynthesis lipoprotein